MPIKLYKTDISPAVRAVMMLCELYKLPVEMINVNLMAKEHLKPDYLKLNPLHTVPVLVDGDVVLHDSHAILIYLAEAYGKNDSLYPAGTKQRALINQKLFFQSSTLFPRLRNVTYPIFLEGAKGVDDKKLKDIEDAYGFLEEFLTRTKYIAGNNLTIADISSYPTVSGMTYILPLDIARYPKLSAWIRDLQEKPYTKKVNDGPGTIFGEFIKKAIIK